MSLLRPQSLGLLHVRSRITAYASLQSRCIGICSSEGGFWLFRSLDCRHPSYCCSPLSVEQSAYAYEACLLWLPRTQQFAMLFFRLSRQPLWTISHRTAPSPPMSFLTATYLGKMEQQQGRVFLGLHMLWAPCSVFSEYGVLLLTWCIRSCFKISFVFLLMLINCW